MKCEHCGNNLQIEDRFCPCCGQPNPFAVQHQKEMQRFSREFRQTQQNVLEQSERFNRHTVRITILAVLVAACAVMAFFCLRADDIRYRQEERQLAARADEYRTQIDALMKERRYTDLYNYMDGNRLYYTNALSEYDTVYTASMFYQRFYENLMMLKTKAVNDKVYTYYTEEELLEELSGDLFRIYETMEVNEYHPEEFTEDKMAYMTDLADTAGQLLVRYAGITEEEAARIPEMTEARLNVMLEDAYE